MHDEPKARLHAVAAVCLWSTVATAFKLALTGLTPAQLILIAVSVSTLCFWLLSAAHGQWRLPRERWPWAVMLGCLNPVLYYLLLFEAYDRLPAQIAQPLNYTWVLVLAVLAGPMLGQRPDRRTFAGLLISYTGVLLVVTQGQLFEQPPWDATGVVLALASTVIWALYWVLNARAGADATPLLTWSFTLSLPALMLIAMRTDAWPAFAPVPLAAAIWVGLFEMGLTFVLWQRALALSANAARLGQLVFLSPFLSLVFIATVLSETVTAWSVSGLVIIVSGILVTRRT